MAYSPLAKGGLRDRLLGKAKGSPADLIDDVFTLARKCGGLDELKRLVDRMARG